MDLKTFCCEEKEEAKGEQDFGVGDSVGKVLMLESRVEGAHSAVIRRRYMRHMQSCCTFPVHSYSLPETPLGTAIFAASQPA